MDWVAVGAVATVALVVTGIWQTLRPRNDGSLPSAQINAKAPVVEYRIDTGEGSYCFPNGWKVELSDDKWLAQQTIERDLNDITFGVVRIYNVNDFVVRKLALELRASRIWSVRVMAAKTLSKSAVGITASDDSFLISVDELPPREEVRVGVISGGGIFSTLTTQNASVTLKNRGLWDA